MKLACPECAYRQDDGRQLYFHRNSVLGGVDRLAVGDEVRFTEENGNEGPQASTVDPVGLHGRHKVLEPAVTAASRTS